jgi:hypothetical protein
MSALMLVVERDRLRLENKRLKACIKRLEGELGSTKADRDSWSNQSDEFAKTAADLMIRIKRLEEAGDAMHWAFSHHDTGNESVANAWRKAKEAKP